MDAIFEFGKKKYEKKNVYIAQKQSGHKLMLHKI